MKFLVLAALLIGVSGVASAFSWKVAHGGIGPWTEVVLSLSSAIGTVGLLGTLWVGYVQLRQLKKEQDQRMRSWLSLGNPHFRGLNRGGNKILPFNELFDEAGLRVKDSVGKLIVTFPVRNVGVLPAYQITNAIAFGIASYDEIMSYNLQPTKETRGILFPGEAHEMQLDVPYEKFVIAHETAKPLRFRARVLYQDIGGQQRWTERIWAYQIQTLRDEAGETDDSRRPL